MSRSNIKEITKNRRAYHDYFIEDSLEAGISLLGTEVKSLRQSGVSLRDAWVSIENEEAFIKGLYISPYEKGNTFNHHPTRPRRLLMHKRQINRLNGLAMQQGYALIPLSLYFKGSLVKVQVGLGKGKKLYDKREDAARRDMQRDARRALKERNI